MKSRGKPPSGDYVVGYRRPPIATQFKPGQSGNPHGRPKALPRLRDLLAKLLNRQVTVQEGGKEHRLPKYELILLRTINDASRGDAVARKDILALVRALDARLAEADGQAADGISAEDADLFEAYLAERAPPAAPSKETEKTTPDEHQEES